jgi:hypothetical protein
MKFQYELGKLYNITHATKGKFTLKVTAQSKLLLHGTIVHLEEPKKGYVDKQVGDSSTLRTALIISQENSMTRKEFIKHANELRLKNKHEWVRAIVNIEGRFIVYKALGTWIQQMYLQPNPFDNNDNVIQPSPGIISSHKGCSVVKFNLTLKNGIKTLLT